jgi:CheY-like chemotaxis protein
MSEIPAGTKRILIIDPREGRQGPIIENLEQKGFHVIEVPTGKQGLGVMLSQQDHLTLIIVQTQVADMNPIEVVAFARQHEKLKEVPIVLSGAYISSAMLDEAMKHKINGIIATPVRKKDQFDKVNQEFDDLLKKLQSRKIDINVK